MEIKLRSTSGHNNLLKQLTRKDGSLSNVYLLKTDIDSSNIRVSKHDRKIVYIDCPGGPRIIVGKLIRNTDLPIVENIEYNKSVDKYIITFKI